MSIFELFLFDGKYILEPLSSESSVILVYLTKEVQKEKVLFAINNLGEFPSDIPDSDVILDTTREYVEVNVPNKVLEIIKSSDHNQINISGQQVSQFYV